MCNFKKIIPVIIFVGLIFGGEEGLAAPEKKYPIYEYKEVVALMDEAKELFVLSSYMEALARYNEAEVKLELIKKEFPDWDAAILLDMTIEDCNAAIEEIKEKIRKEAMERKAWPPAVAEKPVEEIVEAPPAKKMVEEKAEVVKEAVEVAKEAVEVGIPVAPRVVEKKIIVPEKIAEIKPPPAKKEKIEEGTIPRAVQRAELHVATGAPSEKKAALVPAPLPPETREKQLVALVELARMLEEEEREKEIIPPKDWSEYVVEKNPIMELNGQRIQLEQPILVKDDEVWVPLEELAKKFNTLAIMSGADTYTFIRTDGIPLEVTVGKKVGKINKEPRTVLDQPPHLFEGKLMGSLPTAGELLNVFYEWDKNTKTARINAKYEVPELVTVTLPEAERIQLEEIEKPEPPLVVAPVWEKRLLPKEVAAPYKMSLATSSTYDYKNLTHRGIRSTDLSLNASVPDYNFRARVGWKDDTNRTHIRNSGNFAGIYGDDLWIQSLDLSHNLLSPLRSQGFGYEGMEITKFYDPYKAIFAVGETANTVSSSTGSGGVKYIGRFVSAREEYKSEKWDVTGSVLGIINEADSEAEIGLIDYPQSNFVAMGGFTRRFPYDIRISSALALSNYVPDNRVNDYFHDKDFWTEIEMKREKFNLKGTYEYIGDMYVSVPNASTYQDFETLDLSSTYKIAERWNVFGGYQFRRDNTDRNKAAPTTTTDVFTGGTNFTLPTGQGISLSAFHNVGLTDRPNRYKTGSIADDYSIGLSQPLGTTANLYSSYDHYILNPISSTGGLERDTYTLSFFKFFPAWKEAYFRAYQDMRKTNYFTPGAATNKEYGTNIGCGFRPNRKSTVSGNWNLSAIQTEGTTPTATMSWTVNTKYDINPETAVSVDYTLSNYNLRDSNRRLNDWSLFFRLDRYFGFVTGARWGKVSGVVFRDVNDDGKMDPGEPGIPNVLVRAMEGSSAMTDQSGGYVIDEVPPGESIVKIDVGFMPINLTGREPEKVVSLRPYGSTKADFGLIETASVGGTVFIDKNDNGSYDTGEPPVEGAIIYISEPYSWTRTKPDGTFLFEYVTPGKREFGFDKTGIPLEFEMGSAEVQSIELQQADKVKGVNFFIKPRPIEFREF